MMMANEMKSIQRVVIFLGLLLLVAVVVGVYLFRSNTPSSLNVILISVDTLRPDRMGLSGHRPLGRSTTPFLDELAAQGVNFSNAVTTTSWTLPAHYSLMTGVPNEVHNVVQDRVPPTGGLPMIAEIMRSAGYTTGGFYSGPYLHPLFGFERGFEFYESCMQYRTMYDVPMDEMRTLDRAARSKLATANEFLSHKAVTSEAVTDKGLGFIEAHAEKPFFLFLHYFDVHNDYLPPPPYDTLYAHPYNGWVKGHGVTGDPRYNPEMEPADLQHLKALYDGEIAWVDHNLERLVDGIRRLDPGILENTLIIVTSDHGESFFEHGKIGHRNHLFDSEVRIPLILFCPAKLPAGKQVSELVRIYDIVPTITSLAGVETPGYVRGRSLVDAIGAAGAEEPRPAVLELTALPQGKQKFLETHSSLLHKDMKLIRVQKRRWSSRRPLDFGGPLVEEHYELYDLRQDPGEEVDIADSRKEMVEKMKQAMQALHEELARESELLRRTGGGEAPVEVPEHLRRQLEELGYGGGG